jgi:hypothetical protein
MADNTYWTNKQEMNGKPAIARGSRPGTKKAKGTTKQQWWAFGVAGALTLMLCLTINFRAFSELSQESAKNSSLENQIQTTTSENLALQEQIHYLKNDPGTVERESRKFGLRRPKQQVPVPTNR